MLTPGQYGEMVKRAVPPSPVGKNCGMAFVIGGGICALGQLLRWGFERLGLAAPLPSTLTSVSLILLAALLTGCGVFDRIAKVAGAGTLVPITGFSNAMTAPALEFKSEGLILGLGAKMFVIAGPVLCYGTAASAICGLFIYLLGLY